MASEQKATAPAKVVPGTKLLAQRTFYTVHGPYAQPGDVLTVRRTGPDAVMWQTAKGNTVTVASSVQELIDNGGVAIYEQPARY